MNVKQKITKKHLIIITILVAIIAVYALLGDNISNKFFAKKVKINSEKNLDLNIGEEIDVPIKINTDGFEINALELFLRFDPEMLEIVSINTDNSFVEIWITDMPMYDNEKGKVSFAGGVPTPGFNGKGVLGSMVIKSKKTGKAKFEYKDNSRVLLNDGIGTSVETKYSPIVIKIN